MDGISTWLSVQQLQWWQQGELSDSVWCSGPLQAGHRPHAASLLTYNI